jgi:uroporphyrinogen decarboxylase
MTTDLENFRATVEHRRPGRILYHAGFTPDLHRRLVEHAGTEDLAAHYGYFSPAPVGLRPPDDLPEIDYARYYRDDELPEGTTLNAMGVAKVPSGLYHFYGYVSPLKNARDLAEIENYPLRDLSGWDDAEMAPAVRAAHADGKVAVSWIGHIYETAWQIRGYEPFLLDMLERPAWAECLLERLAEQNRVKALAAARAGADLLHCGDDIANQNAMMFHPDLWRRMMLPRWRGIWEQAKRVNPRTVILYHSDGNILDVVTDLADAGVDILNPLQPECLDVDEVHRRVGGRVSFNGCMGTQSTMPWGSPDDVRARVREIIDKYGRDGGLIVAPTHVLEPEVPLANIDALAAACREFGRFEDHGAGP